VVQNVSKNLILAWIFKNPPHFIKPKVQYDVQNSLPLVLILSQINHVKTSHLISLRSIMILQPHLSMLF